MRQPFSFGTPERRRFAMQFGYETRPSFWQEVRSNSHLVIAAIGTAALLGVAAIALWLALPASDRQAVASPGQTIPTLSVKTTKLAPVETAAAMTAAPPTERKSGQVSPAVAATEANLQALSASDPRWNDSQSKAASGQAANDAGPAPDKAAAFAQPEAGTDASTELAKVAAETGNPDSSKTAAIPETRPQVSTRQPTAAATGRILRAVTMRSGPKKNAAALITVPARTSVQVMSCNKWCQVTYNGKTGWIYKSYIKTGS